MAISAAVASRKLSNSLPAKSRAMRRYYAKGGFLGDIDDQVINCLLDSSATAPTPDSELYVLQLGGAISDVDEDATAY